MSSPPFRQSMLFLPHPHGSSAKFALTPHVMKRQELFSVAGNGEGPLWRLQVYNINMRTKKDFIINSQQDTSQGHRPATPASLVTSRTKASVQQTNRGCHLTKKWKKEGWQGFSAEPRPWWRRQCMNHRVIAPAGSEPVGTQMACPVKCPKDKPISKELAQYLAHCCHDLKRPWKVVLPFPSLRTLSLSQFYLVSHFPWIKSVFALTTLLLFTFSFLIVVR